MNNQHQKPNIASNKILLKVQAAHSDVLEMMSKNNWCGYDPFDGLNSSLYNKFPFHNSSILQLAWLQFHKRVPINTRPIVGIKPTCNPKTIALVLMGLLDYQNPAYGFEELRTMVQKLLELRTGNDGCRAWGYPFPWQARAFYSPKNEGNVIATTYCILALDQYDSRFPNEIDPSVFSEAGTYIVKHLLQNNSGLSKPYIRYIPGGEALVHNASLWGATALIIIGKRLNNQSFIDTGEMVARTCVDAQNNDGSWEYGNRSHHRFVDSFHTGYMIEAMHKINTIIPNPLWENSINQAMQYYLDTFVSEEGEVSYYNNSKWPLDSHCFAQAIVTLRLQPDNKACKQAMDGVVSYAMTQMWLNSKKRFVYQRHPRWTNRCNYMRWTQAWMFRALSAWLAGRT